MKKNLLLILLIGLLASCSSTFDVSQTTENGNTNDNSDIENTTFSQDNEEDTSTEVLDSNDPGTVIGSFSPNFTFHGISYSYYQGVRIDKNHPGVWEDDQVIGAVLTDETYIDSFVEQYPGVEYIINSHFTHHYDPNFMTKFDGPWWFIKSVRTWEIEYLISIDTWYDLSCDDVYFKADNYVIAS